MQEVKGVRLIVTPHDLVKENSPRAPSVMVDDEIIAEDKGIRNGKVSEEVILKALIRHGAIPIEEE